MKTLQQSNTDKSSNELIKKLENPEKMLDELRKKFEAVKEVQTAQI